MKEDEEGWGIKDEEKITVSVHKDNEMAMGVKKSVKRRPYVHMVSLANMVKALDSIISRVRGGKITNRLGTNIPPNIVWLMMASI